MCQYKYNKEVRKGKHLTLEERQNIEYWKNNLNKTNKEIAVLLNKSERTIRRELNRGKIIKWNNKKLDFLPIYSSKEGQSKYDYHKTGKGPAMILDVNKELSKHVEEQLVTHKKSPEVIASELEKYGFKSWVCAKTIRNAIKEGNIFLNIKNGKIIYNKKLNKQKEIIRRSKKIPPEKSIDKRPIEADRRLEYGHWEGDTVLGKRQQGKVLFVLTERMTREQIIRLLPNKTKESVIKEINNLEFEYKKRFKEKFKTITFDNGSEFNDYKAMESSIYNKKQRVKVFYAHPYRSGERGSNENNNKFIRRFCPKGKSLDNITTQEVQAIQDWINNYPRKLFKYKSTNDILKEMLIVSR